MENIKVKVELNYHWNLADYPDLDEPTKELLTEHAEERIFQMRKEGYHSGELHYEDNDISIWGWWDWKQKRKEN